MSTTETVESGKFLDLIAAAVAAGSTIKAAAESCGCSERHGYRLSGMPEFRKRVSEIRSQIASEAVGRLTSAATQAVDTLLQLLEASNNSKTRLDASKAILNALGPVSELGELRARLELLESER